MKVILLNSQDIEKDKDVILEHIKEKDTVFVVDHKKKLYDYIDEMNLSGNNQFRIQICQELKNLNVDYISPENNNSYTKIQITKFSQLLEHLDMSAVSYVIVKGDLNANKEQEYQTRIQVCNIIQQLIYLNLPLSLVQVMTEKEARDIEKVRNFEQNLLRHKKAVEQSYNDIRKCDEDTAGHKAQIIHSLKKVYDSLTKAQDNELKIAVAASKKTGKSVVVNSMIECELAPTSLELATPNNCIYRQSKKKGYTLEFKDEKKTFSTTKEISDYIYKIFKSAEMDKKSGYGIEDMNIYYPSNQSGFTSYTVYDTPGPDLAGADGHKEAAHRAIQEADVVVFNIDYSKYLTDTEVDYLKEIKSVFEERPNSLILNVNKLDMRYDSTGDKNIVRILDFIRQKLISIAPEFQACIVTGTSALTYYNCIAAPQIPDCELLKDSTNIKDHLEECIERYEETDEMTILNQVDTMARNSKRFHGITLNTLEEVKQFSGMPNLLSYVHYVASNKARTEKINNLMFKIESEYTNIRNLFRFRELEENLLKNKEKLERARQILKMFEDETAKIFNADYPELHWLSEQNQLNNTVLWKIARESPANLALLEPEFQKIVTRNLHENVLIGTYTANSLPAKINLEIEDAVRSKIAKKVKQDGRYITLIPIACVQEIYRKSYSYLNSNKEYGIKYTIGTAIKAATNYLSYEYRKTTDIFKEIINTRDERLKQVIEKYKALLNEECQMPFEISIPDMTFEFPEIKVENFKLKAQGNADKAKDNRRVKQHSYLEELNHTGILRFIDKLAGHGRYISAEQAKAVYLEENYANIMKTEIMNDSEFLSKLKEIHEKYQENARTNTQTILTEIKKASQSADYIIEQTRRIVDHTDDYEKNIQTLESERQTLNALRNGVNHFLVSWKNQ